MSDSNRNPYRSLRLKEFDYSTEGLYFVTICTYNRPCVFGTIEDEAMILSDLGGTVQDEWAALESRHSTVVLDAFVIMPNHIHGILGIVAPKAGAKPLGAYIGEFKSRAANEARKSRSTSDTYLWQRNYYEHIIRSEKSLEAIRDYIVWNPARWPTDENNPIVFGKERGKE